MDQIDSKIGMIIVQEEYNAFEVQSQNQTQRGRQYKVYILRVQNSPYYCISFINSLNI